jgi:hypothetical protein
MMKNIYTNKITFSIDFTLIWAVKWIEVKVFFYWEDNELTNIIICWKR